MPRCQAPKAHKSLTRVGEQGIRKPRRCEEGAEEPTPENIGKSPVFLPKIGRYRCRFCAKTFKDAKNGRRHQETHGNERKHLCTICDRGFPRTDTMNNHFYKCFRRSEGRLPTEEEMPRTRQRAAAAQREEMASSEQPNQAVQSTQPGGAEQPLFNGLLDINHLANVNGGCQWPIQWYNPNAACYRGVQAVDGLIDGGPASMEPFVWGPMQFNPNLQDIQGQPFNAALSGVQEQPIFGAFGPTLGAQQQFSPPTSSTPSPISSGPTFSESGTPFTSVSPQSACYFPTTQGPQQAPVTNFQYQHAEPYQAPPDLGNSMYCALPQGLSRNASEAAAVHEQPAEPQYISPDLASGTSFEGQGFYQYAPEAAGVNGQLANREHAEIQDVSAFMGISRQQSGLPMDMNAPASDNTLPSEFLTPNLLFQSSDLNNGELGTGPDPTDQSSDFFLWLESLGVVSPENQSSSLEEEQVPGPPPADCGLA